MKEEETPEEEGLDIVVDDFNIPSIYNVVKWTDKYNLDGTRKNPEERQ